MCEEDSVRRQQTCDKMKRREKAGGQKAQFDSHFALSIRSGKIAAASGLKKSLHDGMETAARLLWFRRRAAEFSQF